VTREILLIHFNAIEKPKTNGTYIVFVRYKRFNEVETTAEWHGAWCNIDIPSNDYDEIIWWSDPEADKRLIVEEKEKCQN